MTATDAPPPLSDIVDTMAFFDDWEERYQYVIDLGKTLPAFPAEQRVDANIVKGCQSQVWMTAALNEQSRLAIALDSDAHIVRGLAAILRAMYADRTPAEIAAVDSRAVFDELGLDTAL
ncbi:MAG: SufE family protein, partial [Pseudomonadota bacterium]